MSFQASGLAFVVLVVVQDSGGVNSQVLRTVAFVHSSHGPCRFCYNTGILLLAEELLEVSALARRVWQQR